MHKDRSELDRFEPATARAVAAPEARSPRERTRITISQRMMIHDAVHDPSNAVHAVAGLQAVLERHRRENPEFCATPLFRRLEAQLKPLIDDEAAAVEWYVSGWRRLFSVLRRTGPVGRR